MDDLRLIMLGRNGNASSSLLSSNTYHWRDDAACAFATPEIFEVDSPLYSRERAGSYCDRCPVFDDCKSESGDDIKHVFRAGVGPTPWGIYSRSKARKTSTPAKRDKDTCRWGHVGEYSTYSSGHRECRACKRDRDAGARREAGAVPRGKKETCAKGHSDWITDPKAKKRKCRTCKNERELARYHAERSARMRA